MGRKGTGFRRGIVARIGTGLAMWIFSRAGMFSVVSDGNGGMQIRARNPEHLRKLQRAVHEIATESLWESVGGDYSKRGQFAHSRAGAKALRRRMGVQLPPSNLWKQKHESVANQNLESWRRAMA